MPVPRELMIPLVILVLILGWLGILLGSAALALRERMRPPEARRWWARHAFWIWMAGSLALSYALAPADRPRLFLADDWPVWLPVAVGLPYACAAIAWGLVKARTSTARRAHRQALRGDLLGAIAEVEAALGPDLEPPAAGTPGGPADATPDPWAPPASAGPAPRDRAELALRLNLLGWLEAQRGDWARALGLFERADGLGTGLMIYRTNRAEALLKLGRTAEAGPLIDQALAGVPEQNSVLSTQLLTGAAESLTALGRLDEARAALDRAERHWRQLGPLRLAYRGQLLPTLRATRAALDRATPDAGAPA